MATRQRCLLASNSRSRLVACSSSSSSSIAHRSSLASVRANSGVPPPKIPGGPGQSPPSSGSSKPEPKRRTLNDLFGAASGPSAALLKADALKPGKQSQLQYMLSQNKPVDPSTGVPLTEAQIAKLQWADKWDRRFKKAQPYGLVGLAFALFGLAYNDIRDMMQGTTGVERRPGDTEDAYKTRIRVPTKENRKNIREDIWRIKSALWTEILFKRYARSTTLEREGNPVVRYDTNALAANQPIEDREADVIVQGPDGDMCFFAVFDGHSGYHTSQLLSRALLPTIALSLSSLVSINNGESAFSPGSGKAPTREQAISHLASWKSWLFGGGDQTGKEPEAALLANDPENVKLALKNAFEALDRSIVWDPVHLYQQILKNPEDKSLIGLGHQMMLPALSGSCALVSYLDAANEDLYVALAGDCRAVAGYWVENEKKWRVEVLSEDQTGRNPKELERIRAEHPASERDDVIRNGRVLGGLEPSRAFGDARYKWPTSIQADLAATLLPDYVKPPRPAPARSLTPPYVTARPEITHTKVSLASANDPTSQGELRFLVMATDGLFDRLSSEAVVALVGTYIKEPTLDGPIPKSEVLSKLVGGAQNGFDGKKKGLRTKEAEGEWLFGYDENVATFLIRNSLGGGDELETRKLLSTEPPVSRYQRDDTTVKVIFFREPPAPRTLADRRSLMEKWAAFVRKYPLPSFLSFMDVSEKEWEERWGKA